MPTTRLGISWCQCYRHMSSEGTGGRTWASRHPPSSPQSGVVSPELICPNGPMLFPLIHRASHIQKRVSTPSDRNYRFSVFHLAIYLLLDWKWPFSIHVVHIKKKKAPVSDPIFHFKFKSEVIWCSIKEILTLNSPASWNFYGHMTRIPFCRMLGNICISITLKWNPSSLC